MEDLVIDDESLAYLGDIGQRASLRFGLIFGFFCLWDASLKGYNIVAVLSFLQACSSAVIARQYCGKNERPRQNLQGNCDFD